MYSFIVFLGLICVVLAIASLNYENKSRKKLVREAFNMAAIGVYDSCGVNKKIENFYPIRSVRYTCGRRPKFSRIKADITSPIQDDALSKDAAVFYIDDGLFCIKRRKQSIIWIKTINNELYLLRDKDKVTDIEIPRCFRPIGNQELSYTEMDEGCMSLLFGDKIFMGNTLFEYNSSEALNERTK